MTGWDSVPVFGVRQVGGDKDGGGGGGGDKHRRSRDERDERDWREVTRGVSTGERTVTLGGLKSSVQFWGTWTCQSGTTSKDVGRDGSLQWSCGP